MTLLERLNSRKSKLYFILYFKQRGLSGEAASLMKEYMNQCQNHKNIPRIKKNFRISSHVGSEHITVSPRAPITAGLGLFAPCKDRRGNIRRNNLRKVKQRRTHTEMSDSSV